jgi:hypothetical protein
MSARAAGKKVIVSMANTAASGGYFISQCADVIVALPGIPLPLLLLHPHLSLFLNDSV